MSSKYFVSLRVQFDFVLFFQFCGASSIDFHMGESNEIIEGSYSFQNGNSAGRSLEVNDVVPTISGLASIVRLEFSLLMRMLIVLFGDGKLVVCSSSKRGLKQAESIKAERILGSGDAVCASVASDQQILAVGTKRGVVELYDLAESVSLIRSVSLYDWG